MGTAWIGVPPTEVKALPQILPFWGGLRGLMGAEVGPAGGRGGRWSTLSLPVMFLCNAGPLAGVVTLWLCHLQDSCCPPAPNTPLCLDSNPLNTCTYTPTHTQMYTHTHSHAPTHTQTHSDIYMHTDTHRHSHRPHRHVTHIQTHIVTHPHIHRHVCSYSSLCNFEVQ